MRFLEIACFNTESAFIAHTAGADRIELCGDEAPGGTTPRLSDLESLKTKITVPIMVMIRPRGGDFVYTDTEFDQMKTDIARLKHLADGFVFGVLKELRGVTTVDIERNFELIQLASPLPCTFHRAVDNTTNYQKAVKDVASCGFRNLLTSGGGDSVLGGYENLPNFPDEDMIIMPGGGVRSGILKVLLQETCCTWFHSSAITGSGQVASAEEIILMKQQLLKKQE
jgi:copper homeostasis protein